MSVPCVPRVSSKHSCMNRLASNQEVDFDKRMANVESEWTKTVSPASIPIWFNALMTDFFASMIFFGIMLSQFEEIAGQTQHLARC